MDKEQLVKRLMPTFLEELEEYVQALNRDLLALKKDPEASDRAERFRNLLRTTHSLKGAARSVSVSVLQEVCHHLEEILERVRDGVRPLNSDLFALLFTAIDAIEEAGMRLREEKDLAGSPLAALVPRLTASAGGQVRPANLPSPAPAVAEPTPPPIQERAPVSPVEPASETRAGTVRVAAEKLDSLLARSGELLIARRRLQSRIEELLTLWEAVGRWRDEWQRVEKPLGQLLSEERLTGTNGFSGNGTGTARLLPRRIAFAVNGVAGRLRQLEKELDRLTRTLAGDGRMLDQAAGAVDDEVRQVRMLPFSEACQGLERTVYDLAQAGGKEVDLVAVGGGVELDRSVLEGLKDPLRHLVRNAVDHGTEPAEERRRAGKPVRGRVTVAAVLRGSQVEVSVSDDGRGLDLEALRQQVRKRKLPEPADDRELARLIFLPGMSTAPLITDVSGRGVGLDVVKSRVEALHGTVDLSFTPGQGTRFTLAVPLTLTMLRALLVGAGGQTFAFVGTNIQKLLRFDPREFRLVQGREMLPLDGALLPVASLAATLALPTGSPENHGGRKPILVVNAGDRRMAFLVDELLAEQEIVVKNLGARIRRLPHVAGATILPSGRIALVLNAANLVRGALAQRPDRLLSAPVAGPRAQAGLPAGAHAGVRVRKRLLLAEDSVTTRTLEKSILEAAGYEVLAAVDGDEAWRLLQEHGADLVVSDVEMPHVDGFALTEAVRGSKRFANLPVVLVTARESEADRAEGIKVGANAYLLKSAFDQRNLLETIAQLL